MDQQKPQPTPGEARDKEDAQEKSPGQQPPNSDQRDKQDRAGGQRAEHERENQKR